MLHHPAVAPGPMRSPVQGAELHKAWASQSVFAILILSPACKCFCGRSSRSSYYDHYYHHPHFHFHPRLHPHPHQRLQPKGTTLVSSLSLAWASALFQMMNPPLCIVTLLSLPGRLPPWLPAQACLLAHLPRGRPDLVGGCICKNLQSDSTFA